MQRQPGQKQSRSGSSNRRPTARDKDKDAPQHGQLSIAEAYGKSRQLNEELKEVHKYGLLSEIELSEFRKFHPDSPEAPQQELTARILEALQAFLRDDSTPSKKRRHVRRAKELLQFHQDMRPQVRAHRLETGRHSQNPRQGQGPGHGQAQNPRQRQEQGQGQAQNPPQQPRFAQRAEFEDAQQQEDDDQWTVHDISRPEGLENERRQISRGIRRLGLSPFQQQPTQHSSREEMEHELKEMTIKMTRLGLISGQEAARIRQIRPESTTDYQRAWRQFVLSIFRKLETYRDGGQATEEELLAIRIMLKMFGSGHVVTWAHRKAIEEAKRRGEPPPKDEIAPTGAAEVEGARDCITMMPQLGRRMRAFGLLTGKDCNGFTIPLRRDRWTDKIEEFERKLDTYERAGGRLAKRRTASTRELIQQLRDELHTLSASSRPHWSFVHVTY